MSTIRNGDRRGKTKPTSRSLHPAHYLKLEVPLHTRVIKKIYGNGTITDGVYFLKIRIINCDGNLHFFTGDHVRIRGYMGQCANPIFFSVYSMVEIQRIDLRQMSFVNLLRGTQEVPIKREASPEINVI